MNRLRNIIKLATSKPYKYDLYPAHIPKVLLIGRGIILNQNNEVLLLRRSISEGFDAGLWEFPGGKINKGEIDLDKGTQREILEETGLKLKTKNVFVVTCPTDPENKKYEEFLLVHYIQIAETPNGTITLSSEHSEYKWTFPKNINIEELAGPSKPILKDFLTNYFDPS